MKILFLLDEVYHFESANVKLAKQLANQMQSQDIQPAFLVNCAENMRTTMDGFRTFFFYYPIDRLSYQIVQRAREDNKSTVEQCIALAKHPKAFLNVLSTIIFKKSFAEKVYRQKLEELFRQEQFDAVVSVSCPHYTMFALAGARISAGKFCYMLDPYWSNSTMQYAVSLKREMRLYSKIDGAFVTSLMYAENLQTPLMAYQSKMHVLEFPGIRKEPVDPVNLRENDHRIVCAFVGNLYPSIRSPQSVFEVGERLDKSICFSFTGGGYEHFSKGFFEAWKERLSERLIIESSVSENQAAQRRNDADVLINIGNNVDNQLPSKIFEYISTGKPILNFYYSEKCLSLYYLSKYPLALNVKQGDVSDNTIAKVNEFCKNCRGKRLSFTEIEKLYPNCTPSSVAKSFISTVEKEEKRARK